jgi:hypothetical protein
MGDEVVEPIDRQLGPRRQQHRLVDKQGGGDKLH